MIQALALRTEEWASEDHLLYCTVRGKWRKMEVLQYNVKSEFEEQKWEKEAKANAEAL